MKCPRCQLKNPIQAKFCLECGGPLPINISCPTCGSTNLATAKFCGECGTKLTPGGEPTSVPSPSPQHQPTIRDAVSSAERRQLTVMFCDLVGSTVLASRLDPEDLSNIISAYHDCVAETVARFDGFVAQYMGDGAL